jgi:glycine/D-amino acid oxidase-like deaminating enzyme
MIQSSVIGKACDTLIIGGGILGLWAARHAIKRGENVQLIEKRTIGSGASGGFLGALMPHMPDNWNPKKQFQYDALSSLEEAISELENETGIDCEYRQCGRIMPLTHDKLFPQVERRLEGANSNWSGAYSMSVYTPQSANHSYGDWLNPDIATHGMQSDTLSARVNPRAYVQALEAYLRSHASVFEGAAVVDIRPAGNSFVVSTSTGETVHANRVVVANGWEAYDLLQPFMGDMNSGKSIGRGVKGQAVLLDFEHDDDLPIVYHDGSYVVPHSGNRIAIGSTSQNDWSGGPDIFDPSDMSFYDKAMELVPSLKDAPIIDRWAGVRPRNTIDGRGTSPWFAPVPDYENLIALIGGFKITLGIAHMNFFE